MRKIFTFFLVTAFFAVIITQISFAQDKKLMKEQILRLEQADIKTDINNKQIPQIQNDGLTTTKTSTGNTNWSLSSTWTPSGVPGSGDVVIINHNVSVNTAAVCNTITINGGKTLTVNSTRSLSVGTGGVTNNGTISVANGNTFTSTSTWFSTTGDFTNAGTFTETGSLTRFMFNGTIAQTFTNTGTVTSGLAEFGVANSAGVTISSNSNQIIAIRADLFYGTVTNSNKITLGTGGASYAVVQRGVANNTLPAGSFDAAPTFNVGTGGLNLLYDNGSVAYNTGFEVPGSLTCLAFYIYDAADITLTSNLTISSVLNFYGGTGTPTLRIGGNTLTIGGVITYTVAGAFYGGTSSNLTMNSATTVNAIINGLNNFTINANTTLGGTVTVYGTLALTLGTLTNGSSRLTMGNGATIDRSGGTVSAVPNFTTSVNLIYSGTTAKIISFEFPSSPTVLNNLTINCSGGITLNSAGTVNGAFTPNTGALILSGQILTLTGTVGTIGTGTITGSSASSLTINGSGNMTLPSISGGLSSFTLNRGNTGIVTLSSNVTVYNTLTFSTTSGNISTGAYTLTLGDATTGMGTFTYNSGSTTGVITGKFARYVTAGNTSVLNFPVGDVSVNSSPRTAIIQYSSGPATAGTLTAQYITGNAGYNNTNLLSDAGPYTVDTYSHMGYWQMTAGTLAGGTYSITISPVGFTGMSVYSNLRVLKRTLPTDLWALPGTHVSGTSAPTAKRSDLSGFSQFALGGNITDNPLDGPLPVELTSFTSNVNGRNILLNWTTATETNNSGFEIEKQYSESGQYSDWQKIGFVTGSGTKSTPTNYSYSDSKLNAGKYNYRLKQIDYNGNFEYFNLSNEVVIGNPDKFNVSQNYPNPFNPTTKIDYNIPLDSKVTIKIYDISGREVRTLVNETKQAGYYSVEFNGNNLSSGMYFYRLTAGSFTDVKKMLMIK